MKKLLKHGIFALSVALLVTAFMTSCPPPVGELSWNGYTPPVGFGAVRIVAGNNLARTVKPGTQVTTFQSYRLTFTPTAGFAMTGYALTNPPTSTPIVSNYVGISTGLASHKVNLFPGTYSLAVIAYMDNAHTKPAATATIPGVTISEGDTETINITLTAYSPTATPAGTGDGTFGWEITGISGLTTATMKIIALTGGTGTWATGIDLNDTGNDNTLSSPKSLAPGKYRIDLDLADGTDIFVFPGEQLWVYANMPSVFTLAVQPYMFEAPPGAITVTFNYQSGQTSTTANTNPLGRLDSLPVPDPYTDYTFLGWWSTNGTTGSGSGWGTQITTSYTFTSAATVYGRWLEDSFGQGGTVSLDPLGGVAIVVQDTTNGGTAVDNGDTVNVALNAPSHEITITNIGSFPGSFEVKRGSKDITVGAGGIITLGPATTPINTATAGSHFIFITATTGDGEIQTFHFTIKVGP